MELLVIGDNRGRSLISPFSSKDVYGLSILLARYPRKPDPTRMPACLALASLAFSLAWVNKEAVNSLYSCGWVELIDLSFSSPELYLTIKLSVMKCLSSTGRWVEVKTDDKRSVGRCTIIKSPKI